MSGSQNWPAFLAYISENADSEHAGAGSGVVIGPRHLLTCAHVVFRQYREAGYPDVLNPRQRIIEFNEEIGELYSVGEKIADVVLVDGASRRALFKAIHPNSDIVLLTLDPPASFVAPLPFGDGGQSESGGEFYAHGFVGSGVNRFAPTQCTQSWLTGINPSDHFPTLSNAAEEGMSGGPLIRYFGHPKRPILCGMTVLGGMQSGHGRGEVHSKLSRFLKDNDVPVPPTIAESGSAGVGRDGFLASITINLGEGADFVLDRQSASESSPVCYIARRPLTVADLRALSGADPDDGAMWEAAAATLAEVGPEEIGGLLAKVAELGGFSTARLPGRNNLQSNLHAYVAAGSDALEFQYGPAINAPATVEDLWGPPSSIQGLRMGGVEWCCDRPGSAPEKYSLGLDHDSFVPRYAIARTRGLLSGDRACLRPVAEIQPG